MSAFYMNDAMFDLPDAGFVDRTVTYLVSRAEDGTGIVLLVERRPLPEGKPLRQIAEGYGIEAMKRLRGYRVLAERDIEAASLPGIDVGARWINDEGEPTYTRRIHLTLEATWLIIAGEALWIERERCDAYVDHVLASLRLRE